MRIALIVGVGLVAGSFAYQLFGAQDWLIAAERSWFQFTACLCVGLADVMARRWVGAA
jgi:hypothetical protein